MGTCYIGVAGPDGLEVAERIQTDAGDRDGNKRYATNVRANRVVLLGRGDGGGVRDAADQPRSASRPPAAAESADRSRPPRAWRRCCASSSSRP